MRLVKNVALALATHIHTYEIIMPQKVMGKAFPI